MHTTTADKIDRSKLHSLVSVKGRVNCSKFTLFEVDKSSVMIHKNHVTSSRDGQVFQVPLYLVYLCIFIVDGIEHLGEHVGVHPPLHHHRKLVEHPMIHSYGMMRDQLY